MFKGYFFNYLFHKPNEAAQISKQLWKIENRIIDDINPYYKTHTVKHIQGIYAHLLNDDSKNKEGAEYIVSWFEKSFRKWEAYNAKKKQDNSKK